MVKLVNVEGQKHIIEEVDSAKYLGDIIQADAKKKLSIQERKNRGLEVMQLCKSVRCWTLTLRQLVLEIESVDERLLTRVLSAHSKTPVETLYIKQEIYQSDLS